LVKIWKEAGNAEYQRTIFLDWKELRELSSLWLVNKPKIEHITSRIRNNIVKDAGPTFGKCATGK
jgi:hypothetical protein